MEWLFAALYVLAWCLGSALAVILIYCFVVATEALVRIADYLEADYCDCDTTPTPESEDKL